MRWLPKILLVNSALGATITTANKLTGTELTLAKVEQIAAGAERDPSKKFLVVEDLGPSANKGTSGSTYGVGVDTKLEHILRFVVRDSAGKG